MLIAYYKEEVVESKMVGDELTTSQLRLDLQGHIILIYYNWEQQSQVESDCN